MREAHPLEIELLAEVAEELPVRLKPGAGLCRNHESCVSQTRAIKETPLLSGS